MEGPFRGVFFLSRDFSVDRWGWKAQGTGFQDVKFVYGVLLLTTVHGDAVWGIGRQSTKGLFRFRSWRRPHCCPLTYWRPEAW